MKRISRNIASILIGLVIGSFVNMGIIMSGGSLIPPPEGADVLTMEGLKASMHLFEPKHFLMPFLAHVIGTLIGSMLTVLIAGSNKKLFSMTIGVLFMLGGIANVLMLPSPFWFSFLDLSIAYLPMSYLAWIIFGRR